MSITTHILVAHPTLPFFLTGPMGLYKYKRALVSAEGCDDKARDHDTIPKRSDPWSLVCSSRGFEVPVRYVFHILAARSTAGGHELVMVAG